MRDGSNPRAHSSPEEWRRNSRPPVLSAEHMSDGSPPTKPGFLDDHQGNASSMRLMSVVALMASIAFGLLAVLRPASDNPDGLYITTAFLIAAFAPKALQKFAEARFPASG